MNVSEELSGIGSEFQTRPFGDNEGFQQQRFEMQLYVTSRKSDDAMCRMKKLSQLQRFNHVYVLQLKDPTFYGR